jgi:hypothetical protein
LEEERQDAITIWCHLLEILESSLRESTLLEELLPAIPSIMKAVPSFKGNGRLDVITCLLEMFHLMTASHYDKLIKILNEKSETWSFILKLFQNYQSFLLVQTYPEAWLGLNLFQYKTMLESSKVFCDYCIRQFNANKESFFGSGSESDDKTNIWKQLFRLSNFFIQSKLLSQGIKYGSAEKQREVNERCGQLRWEMLMLLKNMWDVIGVHRSKFLQGLVPNFIDLQMVALYFSLSLSLYLKAHKTRR